MAEATAWRRAAVGPDELTAAGLRRLGPGSPCDEEPIHLSGAIQPHGFLLGVDPTDLVVRVASENLLAFTGTAAADAVGRDLDAVIGPTAAEWISALMAAQPQVRFDPVRVDLDRRGQAQPAVFDVTAHRSGSLTLLEFEPGADSSGQSTAFRHVLRSALDPDLSTVDVRELCAETAKTVQQLTGFDRVLVYKFDDDAHGVVVAEITAPDKSVRSLLGLHYPAGDIPRQARALFLTKRIRAIADVAYEPIALVGQAGRADVATLDLTGSDLRSVSPVHLQYLRQQGIGGTLTLSLVCGETLWGMVLCHHDSPRYVSAQVRSLCETLARTLALQLQVRGSFVGRERAAARTRTVAELVSVLGRCKADDLVDDTLADLLFGLIPADAIFLRLDGQVASTDRWSTWGTAAVDRIVTSACRAAAAVTAHVWWTDRILEDVTYDPANLGGGGGTAVTDRSVEDFGDARGLLVVPFSPEDTDGHGDAIVWVRRETVVNVEWAAPADPAPDGWVPADPRELNAPQHDRSGSVRQQIHDRSAPWTPEDREAASTLLQALPRVVLQRMNHQLAEHDAGSQAALAASSSRQEKLEQDLHRKLRLEALGKMAGGVAHDFNNLLGVILSHAELMDDTLRTLAPSAAPEFRQLTDDNAQLIAATQRAARLTKQLLGFARREVTQPRILSINEVLTDLSDLLDRSVGAHIRLDLVLTDDSPLVLIDPDQLERVVINLAVNARDAMPTGGTVTVATSLTNHRTGQPTARQAAASLWVALEISDTGCGIPADVVDQIFDPFFTTKAEGDGTGLGLSTVHSIVDEAGGHVGIRSQIGEGTTVTVTFPLATSSVDAAPALDANASSTRTQSQQTVLLVDDQPELRSSVRRSLQAAGYQVLEVEDGPAAAALAREYPAPIDILLTDVVMPSMLGRDVAARVRESRPDVKVLFMSGFALAITDGSGHLQPGDALIDKPFRRADLLAKLRDLG